MGLDLSPGGLFAGMLVSSLGVGFCIYGRKQRRAPQFVAGVLMLLEPMVVQGAGLMLLGGAGLVGALWIALRLGM